MIDVLLTWSWIKSGFLNRKVRVMQKVRGKDGMEGMETNEALIASVMKTLQAQVRYDDEQARRVAVNLIKESVTEFRRDNR